MGSVGNQSTVTQKSVREEFESLPKTYEITTKARLTKNQEEAFNGMFYESGKIMKSIEDPLDSSDKDYRHWLVNMPDEINVFRAVDLRAIQRQIDSRARRETFDFENGFSNQQDYERVMKRLYMIQRSLTNWRDRNSEYIGR